MTTAINNAPLSLEQIKTGKVKQPHFVLIYGVDGVCKTTFGAEAPKPVFIGTENGFGNLDVARFPTPRHYQDVLSSVTLLINDKHDYQTLVIDSLDWLEPLVHKYVCEKYGWKSVEDPGYGKGYVEANTAWLELIALLKRLRSKMNIVLIAHAAIRTFTDPEQNAVYDRYQLKLSGQGAKTDASALFREAVDTVLFVNYVVNTTKEKGATKSKAFGKGDRVAFTERRPAFDAKNRFNLPFEIPMELGAMWKTYDELANKDGKDDHATLAELLKNCEKEALAWLRQNNWIGANDGLDKLSNIHRTRILNNPEGFFNTIKPNNEKGE